MKNLNFESLKQLVESKRDARVMLTFHSVGDTDSISAAIGLKTLFKNATIASPDFITGNSRRIVEGLGFETNTIAKEFDDSADMVVLLDVNNFEDCGKFMPKLEGFKKTILIIDHHTPNQIPNENVMVFNDESYNSATSIVYELMKSTGIEVGKNLADLMAAGIISDSAELRNAFPKTFVQIGELLQRSGTDYQSMLLEMQHMASTETRVQFIKDLFNSKIEIINGLLMIQGSAGIHANKIADDAIKIGADIALFHSSNGKELSFSARLRPPLDKTYKINLGRIMKSIAPIINGQGGGHPGAAGAYGNNTSNVSQFIDAFMAEIRKRVQG